jgi:hypothetical protein
MSTDAALVALIHEHHMLATPELVRRAGLTRHQWGFLRRTDRWVPVVPAVWRHAATPLTWEMKVRAGSIWLGRNGRLFGATGMAWLGVEGCATEAVDFLVPRSKRSLPPWMNLHTTNYWTKGDVLVHRGVPTSTATRALIDMARTASPRTMESAIDAAIRQRLTSVPTLSRRMNSLGGSGRAGIRLMRSLLLDSGGESILERRFLQLLARQCLPRPLCQVVHHPSSTRVIRVDFQFQGSALVVEVSGRRGHSSDSDRRRDARRRNELTRMGLTVVEFTTADVLEDEAYVIDTLRTHLSPTRVAPAPSRLRRTAT